MSTKRYDVIVVLGAKPSPDGKRVPAMDRRVRHGVRLFHDGVADFLLMSGGRNGHSTPEAVLMQALAVEEGVPEENVVLESKSTRTLENAFFSKAVMEERGWTRALVVTDKFHLPRALFTFHCFGIQARGRSPTKYWGKATPKRRVRLVVQEVVGLIAYAGIFLFGQAKRIAVKNQGLNTV